MLRTLLLRLLGLSSKSETPEPIEPPTPKGIVNREDITLSGDGVTIEGIPSSIWLTTVADTNSMLPIIDNGDIAILTNGFKHEELSVGDIVVYQAYGSIIHRIISIDEAEERVYTCKGDNNAGKDPYQILDVHINWLLIGIIYCKKGQP